MYQEISQLLMYGDIDKNEILYQMGQLFARFEKGGYEKMELVRDINTQVKRILKVATDYGFDDNLWHNYLTFYLMMNENPFSMTCEKVGASEGSVNALVQKDFAIFKKLFDYDFSRIEEALEISCFTDISNYKAIVKKDLMYNKNVSEKVRALSKQLEETKTSINQYLLNCRLYAAKQMLISTNMSVKEIAIECGFKNNVHFNNFFTSKMNISPLKFRNSSKEQIDVGVFKIKEK